MTLIVHVHTQVHYHIHLIMRQTYVKGLTHFDMKEPDRMYYDSLPGIPPVYALAPDFDTTTYQFHVQYLMHIHVYPNSF
jgi:hypothetical protein